MSLQPSFDRFNQELDHALKGGTTPAGKLPPEEQETLDLARRLSEINLSSQSHLQVELRKRLEGQIRSQVVQSARFMPLSWVWWQKLAGKTLANTALCLASVICLAIFAGCLIGQRLTAGQKYVLSGEHTRVAQVAHSPQPIPTPLAPASLTVSPQPGHAAWEQHLPTAETSRPPHATPGTNLP
jgi:hypothetical protein